MRHRTLKCLYMWYPYFSIHECHLLQNGPGLCGSLCGVAFVHMCLFRPSLYYIRQSDNLLVVLYTAPYFILCIVIKIPGSREIECKQPVDVKWCNIFFMCTYALEHRCFARLILQLCIDVFLLWVYVETSAVWLSFCTHHYRTTAYRVARHEDCIVAEVNGGVCTNVSFDVVSYHETIFSFFYAHNILKVDWICLIATNKY